MPGHYQISKSFFFDNMGQEQSGEGVTQSETSLGGTMTCRNMDTGEVKEVTIDENTTIADFRRMIEGDQVNPEYEKYRQLERSTPHGYGWVATKGTSLEGPCFTEGCKNTSVISILFRDLCQTFFDEERKKYSK
jgi:hypothetical protein